MASLHNAVSFIKTLPIPTPLQHTIISTLIGCVVPFFGTAKIKVTHIDTARVILTLRNKRRVRNHMKGIHASAMGLLAEAASGVLLTMNLPDKCKYSTTKIISHYHKKAIGGVIAEASLSKEQQEMIDSLDKGEITLNVVLKDENGNEPCHFDVTWAWKK